MLKLFDPRHEFGKVLDELRPAFIKAAGFSLAINLLALLPSIYMLQIYDRVLTSRNGMTLVMLTLITMVLYILFGVLDAARTQLLMRIGMRFDERLRDRVFAAAFQRHLARAGGNPAQALQDVASLRQFVAGAGALAFFDAPWLPIFLIVIALIHPWLGVFALCSAIILAGIAWINELLTHKPQEEASRETIAAAVYANNNLRNAETLAAMGMLPAVRERWAARYERAAGFQLLAGERGACVGAVGRTTRIAFQSLILGAGAWLALDGVFTPGLMIAASILLGRALAPAEHMIAAWKQWISARQAHARLEELLSTVPASEPSIALPPPRGFVSLENASAVPPGSKALVLKGLTFQINAGDMVAVIGPSASGKSCLARLLTGIWPPASGSVRLDGADIFKWINDGLGAHVGYLPQEVGLFEGTVAENIARLQTPDSSKVIAAAQLAGVHDLILHLPKGYETPVGTDGSALSGGQRQRIGLARALYGNPQLIVLDEPNSNLDEAGEQALIEALRACKQRGATVIFVAHGTRLLDAADKLLVLRDGALVVYGPRDKVIAHLQSQSLPKVVSS